MKVPPLSVRDLFWLVLVCALASGWCVERTGMLANNESLQREVERLKHGPDWAAMDRIMDRFALHWHLLQKRERELGLPETPDPLETYDDDPQLGDPVPRVPAVVWP